MHKDIKKVAKRVYIYEIAKGFETTGIYGDENASFLSQ